MISMIIIGDQVAPIFVGIQISLQLSWDPWADHWKTNQPSKDELAKLHYTSCLDGVWIKIKKVWINPNNSHESLDQSKLRPSQTPTNHPSEFFGHITFSVPNIKLQKMKSESCWKLYNIQSKNSIMVIWIIFHSNPNNIQTNDS